MIARSGLRLVAYASESATQASITAAGELDYQLIYRWTQSEFGLGQGIVEACRLRLKAQGKKGIIPYFHLQISALSFQPKLQHPHDKDAQAQTGYLRSGQWMKVQVETR
jgi:hypothetical protein